MDETTPSWENGSAAIVSIHFCRPGTSRSRPSAAIRDASGDAAVTTTAGRSPAMRSIGRFVWIARRSGGLRIRATGRNSASEIPQRRNTTASGSDKEILSAGSAVLPTTTQLRILPTTTQLSPKSLSAKRRPLLANNIVLVRPSALARNDPTLLAKSDPPHGRGGPRNEKMMSSSQIRLGGSCPWANRGGGPHRDEDDQFARGQRLRRG